MNCYFVFEGKTEFIVYRKWLSVLLPHLTEIDYFDEVENNNYYCESDMGVPDCYRVAAVAIQEINDSLNYDFLVLCLDADRQTIQEKESEAIFKINEELKSFEYKYKTLPENCNLVVIVQKVCIETWFLGNRKFVTRNPQREKLKTYLSYFDIRENNPEDLGKEFVQNEEGTNQIFGYSTKALFHEGYLREVFKERLRGVSYHKSRPREVQEEPYLRELIKRTESDTNHLLSFQNFISFCLKIDKADQDIFISKD